MAKYGYVTLSMTAASATAGTGVDISHLKNISVVLIQSSSESASAGSIMLQLSLDGTNYTRVASFEFTTSADLASVQAWLTLSIPSFAANDVRRYSKARLYCGGYGAGAVKGILSGDDVSNQP